MLKELLEYEQRRRYLQKLSQLVVDCVKKRQAEIKKDTEPVPKPPTPDPVDIRPEDK